jgi:hypothetical protein
VNDAGLYAFPNLAPAIHRQRWAGEWLTGVVPDEAALRRYVDGLTGLLGMNLLGVLAGFTPGLGWAVSWLWDYSGGSAVAWPHYRPGRWLVTGDVHSCRPYLPDAIDELTRQVWHVRPGELVSASPLAHLATGNVMPSAR